MFPCFFFPIVWISAGGKLKVMAYLIEKAASAYVTEKADGLNIEESFFLYILAQN